MVKTQNTRGRGSQIRGGDLDARSPRIQSTRESVVSQGWKIFFFFWQARAQNSFRVPMGILKSKKKILDSSIIIINYCILLHIIVILYN